MRALPRFGWVGVLATTGLCSYFGAKAAAVLVMAHTLPAAARPSRTLPAAQRTPTTSVQRAAEPAVVAGRNIFCSGCEQAPKIRPTQCNAGATADTELTRSALPLSLTAILHDTAGGDRFAVVHDQLLDRVGVLAPGSPVPGAGPVVAIFATRIVFIRQGRREYIDLRGRDRSDTRAPAERSAPAPKPSALTRRIAHGIRPLGSGKWQIERGALNTVFDNLHQLARQARIVPVVRQGKPAGFRLARVRQGGIYPLIGLQNGDVLEAVNGRSVQSVGQALGSLASMRHATRLTLSFKRAGKPMTFEYAVR